MAGSNPRDADRSPPNPARSPSRPSNPRDADRSRPGISTRQRLLVCVLAGTAAGIAVAQPVDWHYGVMAGWMVAAALLILWTWVTIWPLDAEQTAGHVGREDPGRGLLDILVLLAALASLGAVGVLLAGSGDSRADAGLSLGSVALAWGAVHTVYTTRYADLYYTEPVGGIDFNESDPPQYSDFAYLAFTLGMTYQVSDTDISTKVIRAAVLRHTLLSYLFGAVILAAAINLVVGLAK